MDEEYEYVSVPEDLMCQRAHALIMLAEAADNAKGKTREYLLKAMDNVLFSISLPRGELKEMKKNG